MISETLAEAFINAVWSYISRRTSGNSSVQTNAASAVERHLNEAVMWSQRIQLLGMSRPQDTASATIPLRLSVEPGRFRGSTAVSPMTEADLLRGPSNYVILGDPGSGKTTILKRLVQRLLTTEPDDPSDSYQFPVVIRLRELDPLQSIAAAVAVAIGIPAEAIIDFMNDSRAVLLLDGLHETPYGSKERILQELARMALNTKGSKIIVSCRTGDYQEVLEGFDVVEVSRLTASETTTIAALWLDEPYRFLSTLSRMPYRDLADRPLLLTQLIFIYQRYGRLPEQPVAIYRRLIALLLEEWDVTRSVSRRSKYAQFSPELKLDFLAAVAYQLTHRTKARVFSAQDLAEVYLTLHMRFQLPPDEAHQVIRELQTHTGIITTLGDDSYEFAHLSLQEYLCAEYLIREPFPSHLNEYLEMYPAPVAITVVLSSNPSASFAALFLHSAGAVKADIQGFLSRLLLEHPVFTTFPPLGMAVMKIYLDVGTETAVVALMERFLELPGVGTSVSAALQHYAADVDTDTPRADLVRLKRTRAVTDSDRFMTPDVVRIPLSVLDRLALVGDTHAAAIAAATR